MTVIHITTCNNICSITRSSVFQADQTLLWRQTAHVRLTSSATPHELQPTGMGSIRQGGGVRGTEERRHRQVLGRQGLEQAIYREWRRLGLSSLRKNIHPTAADSGMRCGRRVEQRRLACGECGRHLGGRRFSPVEKVGRGCNRERWYNNERLLMVVRFICFTRSEERRETDE